MNGWKALLVDDEEEFVSALAERLRMRGLEVQVAADGESALSAIEGDPPQVVVLDVWMPKMDGLEILRRIKRDRPHIPVILLTGKGSTRDGIDGMRLGAFDYLMKPVHVDELIRIIEEAVEGDAKVIE